MAYSIRRVSGIGKEEKLAEKMNVMVILLAFMFSTEIARYFLFEFK